jgi:DNA-binding SARP family transcriptional activator
VAPELISRALDMLPRSRPVATCEAAGTASTVGAASAAGARSRAAVSGSAPGVLPAVRIQLLGDFAAHVGDEPAEDGLRARSRTRELLAYLAVFPDGRRRDEIAADLWPEAESGQDKTLIQTTVHRLRQALYHEAIVTGEGEPYRLNAEAPLDVDVRRFEQSVAAARAAGRDPEARTAHLLEAVQAYGGPFLPGSYADWVQFLRRRLEREYVAALAQLAQIDWEAGEYRRCLDWCHRLIEVEPEDEAIHARIVACYEALGEPMAAALHRRRREMAEVEEHGSTRKKV